MKSSQASPFVCVRILIPPRTLRYSNG
uniref:BZIP family transcription factor n=1 Tax=Arabidopsis thaliana TaxID=3702 RepID=Q1PDZ4_ARATH|nr:bZIP family transcription factor [Arabidopsis thaliana]